MSKASNSKYDLALLILRVGVGVFMITHGYPKLMKFFASGPIKFINPIGIGAVATLVLTTFSEFFCSLAIVLGFKTKLASIPLAITMFVAVFIVHANDPWGSKEKGALYLIIYLALALLGSGKYSLDQQIKK